MESLAVDKTCKAIFLPTLGFKRGVGVPMDSQRRGLTLISAIGVPHGKKVNCRRARLWITENHCERFGSLTVMNTL